jgi:hypothetical protein
MKNSVYEAYALRDDGTVFTCEVMECGNSGEAVEVAMRYARKWSSRIKLYQVPAVNTSSVLSFNLWPDDMTFIAEIDAQGPIFRAAQRTRRSLRIFGYTGPTHAGND